MLFNLYSEFMIREAIEEMEGISFGGFNITDFKYADDAVLMVVGGERVENGSQACFTLDGVPLEQVT